MVLFFKKELLPFLFTGQSSGAPAKKIERAFENWAVIPFEMTMDSLEAQELLECGFGFAQASLRQGYAAFEAAITPVLAPLASHARMTPERMAHVLASAVRGFKQTADTPGELRRLIKDLLLLTCRPGS